ncbi:hypothetical protein [Chitinophaga sp. Cy-1792]|nr:hypothetical protein [Chitinophaga sp. Cy-1792]
MICFPAAYPLAPAKRVLVEAEFYNSGKKVMEFEVGKLDWNH